MRVKAPLKTRGTQEINIMMTSMNILAWFALTLSCVIAKPLSRRISRSTENDPLNNAIDDSLATPFQVPSWLQIYQTFFSNVVDENILPELKESNIEISEFKPHETTLENNAESSQSEDIGDSNILANDGISEWERDNINTELDATEPAETVEVSDDIGTYINNFGQLVELDDDSLKSMIGTPWGMIQNLREMAEEINDYEVESYADRQSDVLENLLEMNEPDVPGGTELENFGSDDMVTFEDINNMLNDDNVDNTMDTDTLDVADVHENALESNSVDDRDSTIEVAGMEFPGAEAAEDNSIESGGNIDSTFELEGIEGQDGAENIISRDNTEEVGGIEETSEGLTGTENPDIGESVDSTIETGGMEFSTNEGTVIEMPDSTAEIGGMEFGESVDSTIETGGMEFPTNEGTGIEMPDTTAEIGGMEFETGVNAPDDAPELSPVIEPSEMGFDSGVELPTVNDEINSDLNVLPEELNFDQPSNPEPSILNDENKVDFPHIDDALALIFGSELSNSVDELKNDEPVT